MHGLCLMRGIRMSNGLQNSEAVDVASLTEDPQNARKHDRRNIEAIKNSLKAFNQVEPLVVQRSSRKVIGGNGRLQAMKELGIDTVWVHFVDLPDDKAKALGIALNKTASLAEWDFQSLADVLTEIDSGSFDVPSFTAFTGDELEKMMNWTPKPDHKPKRKQQEACPLCGK